VNGAQEVEDISCPLFETFMYTVVSDDVSAETVAAADLKQCTDVGDTYSAGRVYRSSPVLSSQLCRT